MTFNHEWGLKWPDKVFTPLYGKLGQKPREWPKWWRRIYLLTLPVSFPFVYIFRWTIFSIGILAMVVALFANYFYCTWHGKKGGLR